jgi:hypothetical protein
MVDFVKKRVSFILDAHGFELHKRVTSPRSLDANLVCVFTQRWSSDFDLGFIGVLFFFVASPLSHFD